MSGARFTRVPYNTLPASGLCNSFLPVARGGSFFFALWSVHAGNRAQLGCVDATFVELMSQAKDVSSAMFWYPVEAGTGHALRLAQ